MMLPSMGWDPNKPQSHNITTNKVWISLWWATLTSEPKSNAWFSDSLQSINASWNVDTFLSSTLFTIIITVVISIIVSTWSKLQLLNIGFHYTVANYRIIQSNFRWRTPFHKFNLLLRSDSGKWLRFESICSYDSNSGVNMEFLFLW